MVKKYYVITTGAEVGVFYDHWINVAPLVKNSPGSVYQGAASQEEAEELFGQAKAKGNVHISTARPTSSPVSIRSPQHTGSISRTTNNSGSGQDNSQRSKHAERLKLSGIPSTPSKGHRHVYNNPSPYIPAHPKVSRANSGGAETKLASTPRRVLARTYSEPNHQVRISAEDSFDAFRVQTPSYKPNEVVATVVDSPPWLASYPEEDEDEFTTPPLCPTASPMVSSRRLGPNKSEPASTYSRYSSYDRAGKGLPASECGRDSPSFHSPKPGRQSSHSSRAKSSSKYSNNMNPTKNSSTTGLVPTTSRSGTPSNLKQTLEVVESMSELMTTVGRLVNDLRVQLENIPSVGSKSQPLFREGRSSPISTSGSSKARSRGSSLLSSTHSNGNRGHFRTVDEQQPLTQTPTAQIQSPHSLLFSQDVLHTPQLSTPCKHCHGTGCDSSGTSILDQTGLIQPSLGPYHSHDSTEDPRSPFVSSKALGLRGSSIPVTLGRPSPMPRTESLSMQLSPLLISPRKRK